MNSEELVDLLNGKLITCGSDNDVDFGFSSDLMSDVLTLEHDKVLLITGLANPQAVRTADMAGISNIVLVRDKKASDLMVTLAKDLGITLIETPFSMYRTSALLASAGLKHCF
jgi:hypothetical protein